MVLKEKLQRAAVEVARLKQLLNEAESYYDALYQQATGGSTLKKISPNKKPSNSGSKASLRMANGPKANFTDRLEKLFLSDPSKEWSYPEIFNNFPEIPKLTVRSLLMRLKKAGKANQAKRGKWKAV